MFAIVETGGKQYRVEEGQRIDVEKLEGEPGETLKLDKVLMVGQGGDVKIGTPFVSEAKVDCEIVSQGRTRKIIVFKKKRRKDYQKKQGHRQMFTTLKVKSIQA
jgi:large subunit ribosomal protein L21